MKCVYLHVPKCAGVSLRNAIIAAHGRENVYWDYGENPANPMSEASIDPIGHRVRFAKQLPAIRRKVVALGHFDVGKYAPLMGDAKFFTILRHPVDRLISHYYYWQQDIDNPVFTQHPIRNYVMRRNLSLFEFAQLPAIQNFYTGVMFRDFPMEAFDLIGSVETLGDHREQIEDLCGASLTVGFENTSPRKSVGEGEIAALNKLLNLDIEFYQRWTGHRLQSG